MLTSRFDDVFLIAVRRSADRLAYNWRTHRTVDDLEFSEFERSPRNNIVWVFLALVCFWSAVGLVIVAPI
jgi:hypothetical protein